jgi:hypothetical protein
MAFSAALRPNLPTTSCHLRSKVPLSLSLSLSVCFCECLFPGLMIIYYWDFIFKDSDFWIMLTLVWLPRKEKIIRKEELGNKIRRYKQIMGNVDYEIW